MDEYQSLKGKFFCNTCHSYFEKGRDAISNHERGQKHKRMKDKDAKWKMHHNKKEKTEQEKYDEEVKYLNERNQARYSGAPPPKPTKTSAPAGKGVATTESGYGDHGSTFQKGGQPGAKGDKPGPKGGKNQKDVAEPVRRDLGISFNPQEMKAQQGSILSAWTVRKDNETGKLVFYNAVSGTRHEERPRGVKLSAEDEKKWEEYQKNPTQNVDLILDPTVAEGNVGGWEEVDATEDFYAANALSPEKVHIVDDGEEFVDEAERQIEEKLDRLEELDEDELNQLQNFDKADPGKSLLRTVTDKLKQIEDRMESVSKPTFKKDSDILYTRIAEGRIDENEDGRAQGNNVFKKRKTQNNTRNLLGFEKEEDLE